MYLRSLTLQNFVCFEDTEVSFRVPGEDPEDPLCNFTLLLGDNGAGKTALLRAITILGLGDLLDQSGFVPHHLIRFQQEKHTSLTGIFYNQKIKDIFDTKSHIIKTNKYEKLITTSTLESKIFEKIKYTE
jgi:recombinational DNA repair ATPase RecF